MQLLNNFVDTLADLGLKTNILYLRGTDKLSVEEEAQEINFVQRISHIVHLCPAPFCKPDWISCSFAATAGKLIALVSRI
jgi:hypothetical protein